MATEAAAVHQFLEGFLPAYPGVVPDDAALPYITYDLSVGDWGGGEVNVPVTLWFRTESEAVPNAKAREVARAIGLGGVVLPCDGGALWIKRGSPWMNSLDDQDDPTVKRRVLNLDIEYMTTY